MVDHSATHAVLLFGGLSIGSVELSEATIQMPQRVPTMQRHSNLQLSGKCIMYVRLPGDTDAPELMRSRMRAIDKGRTQFTQRVRKTVQPKPQGLAPLVSERVTEADEHGA